MKFAVAAVLLERVAISIFVVYFNFIKEFLRTVKGICCIIQNERR